MIRRPSRRPGRAKPLWFKLLPDTEFIENICDNEKDVERIKAIAESAR